jgi:hypothetical protein
VGKKDLPVGIRNRFTENDLLILVGDYLNSTGIQKIENFQHRETLYAIEKCVAAGIE